MHVFKTCPGLDCSNVDMSLPANYDHTSVCSALRHKGRNVAHQLVVNALCTVLTSHGAYVQREPPIIRDKRERVKCTKYESKMPRGVKFVPFVFETFGKLGPRARAILSRLSKLLTTSSVLGKSRRHILNELHVSVASAIAQSEYRIGGIYQHCVRSSNVVDEWCEVFDYPFLEDVVTKPLHK